MMSRIHPKSLIYVGFLGVTVDQQSDWIAYQIFGKKSNVSNVKSVFMIFEDETEGSPEASTTQGIKRLDRAIPTTSYLKYHF